MDNVQEHNMGTGYEVLNSCDCEELCSLLGCVRSSPTFRGRRISQESSREGADGKQSSAHARLRYSYSLSSVVVGSHLIRT
jgi:hypothetical protein